ncbi:MAG: hypothetical protein K8R99_01475 [Actinomycetia bacterium]|nr:hypothetical protein [Actinomycetes bacterium]
MLATVVPPTAIALAVCLLLGAATFAVGRAATETPRSISLAATNRVASSAFSINGNRVLLATATGFLVLLATRWLMLSLLVAAMVFSWKRLLHDQRADDERRRIEGIAKWLEDLRDTLRGSAVGAEEALEQVALRPPAAITGALQHFTQRRRQGYRTENALADLAEELAHPTADAAIAAICLVIGGSTGAGRLYGTVNSLAAAARYEVTARERIDRTRAVYQSSMKRLVVIGGLLVTYLRFAAGGLLDPYNTAVGQVVLLLPLSLWLGCVLWLRSLCRYESPTRYRLAAERVATQ